MTDQTLYSDTPNNDRHKALVSCLRDVLMHLASNSADPVTYLNTAKDELTKALVLMRLPAVAHGQADTAATRDEMAEALEEAWPEVIEHFLSRVC